MTRKSRQKEAVLRVVKNTNSHPAADWVYEQVRQEIPGISLGTVYRNLKMLKQDGEILELDLAGALSRFDGRTENHYHFRCERCGRVFDLDEPVNGMINGEISRKTGFRVTHHRLEFRGLCQDCQQKAC